jgi:hypothetical protein
LACIYICSALGLATMGSASSQFVWLCGWKLFYTAYINTTVLYGTRKHILDLLLICEALQKAKMT